MPFRKVRPCSIAPVPDHRCARRPRPFAVPPGPTAAEPPVFQKPGRHDQRDRTRSPISMAGGPVEGSSRDHPDWKWRHVVFFANAATVTAFAASRALCPRLRVLLRPMPPRAVPGRPRFPAAWSIVVDRLYLKRQACARVSSGPAELPDVIARREANWPASLALRAAITFSWVTFKPADLRPICNTWRCDPEHPHAHHCPSFRDLRPRYSKLRALFLCARRWAHGRDSLRRSCLRDITEAFQGVRLHRRVPPTRVRPSLTWRRLT